MPLLTVRLTDEEMAALKALAAESSMAEVIRGWIAGPHVPPMPSFNYVSSTGKITEPTFSSRPFAPVPKSRKKP